VEQYRSPRWLPGGNAQTIWPALFGQRHRGPRLQFRRERWTTPDADFIDADWLEMPSPGSTGAATPPPEADPNAPLLVMFHGLEGSTRSHYAQAFADWARRHGWRFVMPHFRGCSGELNRAPRAYHSGDFEEIGWMLALGGNALLRWAEEAGDTASATARVVAAISSPIDLAAGGHAIGRGFNRLVYTRMFLRSMKPKALAKLAQHPGLFSREKMLEARDLYEFDDVFTAPLHGFAGTDDYWRRGSAKPHLPLIRIPALVLNALNDPFVPGDSLPRAHEVGRHVRLWQPAHGGHVGFPGGRWPGHVMTLPEQVMGWIARHL
jgi:uncharacterized protein